MRNPGSGRCWRPSALVRSTPVLLGVFVGMALVSTLHSVRADSVMDRWRLFSPISAQKVVTNPNPAVVRVMVDEGKMMANGSGSLVATRDQYGLVVTNWHVVRDAKGAIQVVFPEGFRSEATVLKTDQDWDLAALLIWSPKVAPLSICATAPQPGDPLTIAGYGQGDYRAVTGKCTQYLAPSMKHPYEIVELSAEARKGDSGGPILNDRGELVGVLFGADRGSTSGSYCGRVRWFLSSVWPELETSSTARPHATPLVGFPTDQPAVTDSIPLPNLIPITPLEAAVESGTSPGGQLNSEFEPPAEITVSTPFASLPSLPSSSANSSWYWKELIGNSRWDQAKTLLAAIGLLAVWGHLSRWIAN